MTEISDTVSVKCDNCDGSGIINAGHVNPNGKHYQRNKTCPKCKGKGYSILLKP